MDFTNIERKIAKLDAVDVNAFENSQKSFKNFVTRIEVEKFRRLSNVEVTFDHPVTLIAGTNRIGKTSLLLLLAGSHERFMRLDASKPEPTWREHAWKDVITFTHYETETKDYQFKLNWRTGNKENTGIAKRLASSKSWSGLGKKSSEPRVNAKIKEREVRFIDLERILPARNFSASLLRKSANGNELKLEETISKAYCYILDKPFKSSFEICEVAGHVNKRCYLIKDPDAHYSSYGAASGEESLINLLRDIIEAPENSLILIDELEAGLHPSIQRKLCKVLRQISWENKKQFIITTHSSTILDSLPSESRKFISYENGKYRTIRGISTQAAMSKMDAIGHPLVRLYCEDKLAEFLIRKVMVDLGEKHEKFGRLFEIVRSGAASDVKIDFERHKHHREQSSRVIGFCAIIDGDHADKPEYSSLQPSDCVHFLTPKLAPEKFLAEAFLLANRNEELAAFNDFDNHHAFFGRMVELDLATDRDDARNRCYEAFSRTEAHSEQKRELEQFLVNVATKYTP